MRSVNVRLAMPRLALSAKIFIFSMFVFVLACTTTSTEAGNSHVAAHVIAVGVRVDQQRHGLRRQLLDLVEDRLTPAGVLRVDHRDAVGRDEHGGVAAAAAQDEQVVVQLLDLHRLRLCAAGLTRGRDANRQSTNSQQRSEHHRALHRIPPDKNTRSTNQNPPAAITATEPATATRRPASGFQARIPARTPAAATTTSNCPISTPMLNDRSDQPSARDGKSMSRSTLAKPKPWIRPNARAIHGRRSRPFRTRRLSTPT